jgi:organic radical activating enzyme
MVKVSEIFFSIQGEGWLQGLPAVFIRLAGCNLRCWFCDTKYAWETGRCLDEKQIVKRVVSSGAVCTVITGGEPYVQDFSSLAEHLRRKGFFTAVETNGTIWRNVPCDWVTVSPKREGFNFHKKGYDKRFLKVASEFKYVISDESDFDLIDETVKVPIILQPINNDMKIAKMIAEKIKSKQKAWFLRLQMHKFLKLP